MGFTRLAKIKTNVFCFLMLLLFAACENNGKQSKLTSYGNAVEESDNSVVNAIEQAKPSIMVLPSDNLLQSFDALKNVSIIVAKETTAAQIKIPSASVKCFL